MSKQAGAVIVVSSLALMAGMQCCSGKHMREQTTPDSAMTAESKQVPDDEIIQTAKDAASEAGYDVSRYSFKTEPLSSGWMVHFELLDDPPYLGGDSHFTVQVDEDGSTRVLRGR